MKEILFFVCCVIVSTATEMKIRQKTEIIVIHHSDSEHDDVHSIRQFHTLPISKGGRGWDDIGYHYIVCNGKKISNKGGDDGEIQIGRDEKYQGAHAFNGALKPRNKNSVGICLIGKKEFTQKQKKSLIQKVLDLCKKYHIAPSEKTIQAHHKECPGANLDLKNIIAEVKQKIEQQKLNNNP